MKKKVLITFLITLLILSVAVGGVVLLNANLLLPWQKGARRNRRVIFEYAEEHYPSAIVVEEKYSSAKLFIWNNLADTIVFNMNGIEFDIIAEAGEIITDEYPKASACAQFDKIIQDGFLKPRGITANTHYMFADSYRESYPYTGGLVVGITVVNQGTTPQDVGWLYDFYKYWRSEGNFLTRYRVRIDIVKNDDVTYHSNYSDKEEFSDESEFYSAFKAGPL